MKKNNKFRNNGNSNAYSLNYRFDSISPAGKASGTALDLIKRYNELAKEAHGSGNYIEMEVYRQYAEHYRKIVTEINERKNSRVENQQANASTPTEESNVEDNNANEASANEQKTQRPVRHNYSQPKKEKCFSKNTAKTETNTPAENNLNTDVSSSDASNQPPLTDVKENVPAPMVKKSFKVIEIHSNEEDIKPQDNNKPTAKPRRKSTAKPIVVNTTEAPENSVAAS